MKTNNNKQPTKKIVWGSRDGFAQVVTACESKKKKKCRLFIDNEDDWINEGITRKSQIRIVCLGCRNNEVYVRLANFIDPNKSYRCGCKERYKETEPWRGKVGFERLLKLCKTKGVRPMLGMKEMDVASWIIGDFKAISTVSLKCCKCLITVNMPLKSFAKVGHQVTCLCSPSYPWKSSAGYEEFQKLLDRRRCIFDLSLDRWMGIVETNSSKVPIICCKCDVEVTSTTISKFQLGHLNCGCHLKTESMVREFLKDKYGKKFGERAIISGSVPWCKSKVTGSMLPFDGFSKCVT